MKVVNTLQVYEVNGDEVRDIDHPVVKIKSHWNYTDRVVIETPNGEKFTVLSSNLVKAVRNAENHE